jgi:hypothetical protein
VTAEDLSKLIRNCDDLSRCDDCGSVFVTLSNHTCPSEGGPTGALTRQERERLAARDSRDDDDTVGVYRRSQGGAYAYHELDGSVPVCGCHSYTKARQLDHVTRAEAKRRGRSPCGTCRRVTE